jgi:hypothetical protein
MHWVTPLINLFLTQDTRDEHYDDQSWVRFAIGGFTGTPHQTYARAGEQRGGFGLS